MKTAINSDNAQKMLDNIDEALECDVPVSREDGQLTVLEADDPDEEDDSAPGQLAIAATHNANLVRQGCELPPEATLMRKHQIIGMWENAEINAQAYMRMLLQYEMDLRAIRAAKEGKELAPIKFDELRINKLIFDWRGTPDPISGKCKELTLVQILSAIAKFAEKATFKIDNLEFYLLP